MKIAVCDIQPIIAVIRLPFLSVMLPSLSTLISPLSTKSLTAFGTVVLGTVVGTVDAVSYTHLGLNIKSSFLLYRKIIFYIRKYSILLYYTIYYN